MNGFVLAYASGSADCLNLHAAIEPRVRNNNTVGRREIESFSSELPCCAFSCSANRTLNTSNVKFYVRAMRCVKWNTHLLRATNTLSVRSFSIGAMFSQFAMRESVCDSASASSCAKSEHPKRYIPHRCSQPQDQACQT